MNKNGTLQVKIKEKNEAYVFLNVTFRINYVRTLIGHLEEPIFPGIRGCKSLFIFVHTNQMEYMSSGLVMMS